MKVFVTAIFLFAMVTIAYGQSEPVEACSSAGFALTRGQTPKVAEVAAKGSAQAWLACNSPRGCVSIHVDTGSPVQIYRVQGPWTCGYEEDSHGGGPVWFRTIDLRPVSYNLHPPLTAWLGTWSGGEDRVIIRKSQDGSHLFVRGNATWHGLGDDEHFGSLRGEITPHGNHAEFAEGGCKVDMTLLGKFILANDNGQCGGMNVRFGGFWKRAGLQH